MKFKTCVTRRWEITAAEQLPDYLKICFKALNDITNEISYIVYKKHGWNPIDSLKASVYIIYICNFSMKQTVYNMNMDVLIRKKHFVLNVYLLIKYIYIYIFINCHIPYLYANY